MWPLVFYLYTLTFYITFSPFGVSLLLVDTCALRELFSLFKFATKSGIVNESYKEVKEKTERNTKRTTNI